MTSCKSSSTLVGVYQTSSTDSVRYSFDMDKHKFTKHFIHEHIGKGSFKTVVLSSEKTLLVCNTMIIRKNAGLIKEANAVGNSSSIGVSHGFKILGNEVFEITSKKDGTFLFRKTHTNQLQETEDEGTLVKIN